MACHLHHPQVAAVHRTMVLPSPEVGRRKGTRHVCVAHPIHSPIGRTQIYVRHIVEPVQEHNHVLDSGLLIKLHFEMQTAVAFKDPVVEQRRKLRHYNS